MFRDLFKDTREPDRPNIWHTLTGDVTLVGPKNEGGLLLRLMDIKYAHEITVAIQVPLGNQGCNVRKEISKWSDTRISLAGVEQRHTFISKPMVKVTGKVFYGNGYSFHDNTPSRLFSNGPERNNLAMWDIYPIMKHDLVHDPHS